MSATTFAWFWLGFAAGILATGTAAYLTGRWLTRYIPVTGPIDTALTPTDGTITADPGEYHIDWSQATVEPARVGGWRPVTSDDTLSADGAITPLPVRHVGAGRGDMTIRTGDLAPCATCGAVEPCGHWRTGVVDLSGDVTGSAARPPETFSERMATLADDAGLDIRGPTTHYPPFSTHHDLVATEHDDGTTTYGPDDPTGDSR